MTMRPTHVAACSALMLLGRRCYLGGDVIWTEMLFGRKGANEFARLR